MMFVIAKENPNHLLHLAVLSLYSPLIWTVPQSFLVFHDIDIVMSMTMRVIESRERGYLFCAVPLNLSFSDVSSWLGSSYRFSCRSTAGVILYIVSRCAGCWFVPLLTLVMLTLFICWRWCMCAQVSLLQSY